MDDLEEAIKVTRMAVDITPSDHPDLTGRLNNLGNKLASRYRRTGKMDDLEEAIKVTQTAVEITPSDHPDLAIWLNNWGNKLASRYRRTGKMDDLEEASSSAAALDTYRRAWHCPNAPPFVRLRASRHALLLLQDREDFEAAYRISVDALDLLPRVHTRSLSRNDQQHVVSLFSGLATSACSLALQLGKPPSEALEVLEKGRALILGLLIDDRSDVSALRAVYPDLCTKYESLREEVNTPIKSNTDQRLRQIALERFSEAIEELEKCTEEIRRLPQFSRFQKALAIEEMQKCSAEGCIIVMRTALTE
ncbi:hypothetical protein EJ06DRAFT_536507 [Trichodelitschia bisporula]|uniref:Uncharacterized protein n=1 Tax=Trichodelitschia bisporula TaxID=703511 RepID=A0A6G1I4W6_9PEZI|nr:hypothetical protein EJ06DRAFT_536507 [Trichodelitschia bisporula]